MHWISHAFHPHSGNMHLRPQFKPASLSHFSCSHQVRGHWTLPQHLGVVPELELGLTGVQGSLWTRHLSLVGSTLSHAQAPEYAPTQHWVTSQWISYRLGTRHFAETSPSHDLSSIQGLKYGSSTHSPNSATGCQSGTQAGFQHCTGPSPNTRWSHQVQVPTHTSQVKVQAHWIRWRCTEAPPGA